ncbi:uncharacterized protein LOC129181223 isoform X1 [Dunckerocampus dactyliophorus]|uniref:uncharacterized protein LOC129181223 isoform X1 n=2 Tax=Dunckerocampus dactyliophorus TaxID=161453 RepID=UPI00240674A3|nr:uncharacterized protein LOC129181223 isoform X1 [Dunckerocampus dactyliophorus]
MERQTPKIHLLVMVSCMLWALMNAIPVSHTKGEGTLSSKKVQRHETDEYDATIRHSAPAQRRDNVEFAELWTAKIKVSQLGRVEDVRSLTVSLFGRGICGVDFKIEDEPPEWGSDQCTLIVLQKPQQWEVGVRLKPQWREPHYPFYLIVDKSKGGAWPDKQTYILSMYYTEPPGGKIVQLPIRPIKRKSRTTPVGVTLQVTDTTATQQPRPILHDIVTTATTPQSMDVAAPTPVIAVPNPQATSGSTTISVQTTSAVTTTSAGFTTMTTEPVVLYDEYCDNCTYSNYDSRNNNSDFVDYPDFGNGRPRSFETEEESKWEQARYNGWYKWIWYTTREMTNVECIACSAAPTALPIVIPEKNSFKTCADEQRQKCKKRGFVSTNHKIRLFSLPMCTIQCRLIYGSKKTHNLMSPLPARAKDNVCTEFGLTTALDGPPTKYKVDRTAEYECFASGGFKTDNQLGNYVGNTTVKCKVTWVLSWFPHANMIPIFVTRPVWYENPGPNDQSCQNITMTIPNNQFLAVQSTAVADSYWMCGDDILRNVLPQQWIGLCTLVRMKVPVQVMYKGVREVLQTQGAIRFKRSYIPDSRVYLDAIGQPRGIPEEFKARSEIKAGLESIFLWITPNKNAEWINYVYYNQQRFINYTNEALRALGEQLHETTKMSWQNRQALDWMLAEKGGVCHMFGEQCCTYIPMNTARRGSFTTAMSRISELSKELTGNAGKDVKALDWFTTKLGHWGANLARTGITAVIVLTVICLLLCCIVPILKKVLIKTFVRQMTALAVTKVAEAQLAQLVVEQPDLFPNPDDREDDDTDSEDSMSREV